MKTLLLGLDAFDPTLFEKYFEEGILPTLGKYMQAGNYARFKVANPPQSEVSWTSIATGLNPGGHGLFDFVHRDPANYRLHVSLLPTRRGLLGAQFAPPFNARTIFDQAVRDGFSAAALWWPAMFPARPQSPVVSIPGLGTPDIHGRLGVGTLFTNNKDLLPQVGKTPVSLLHPKGRNQFVGDLHGPGRKRLSGVQDTVLPLKVSLMGENRAHCQFGDQDLELTLGVWSPVSEIQFKSGRFFSTRAVTRFILTQTTPDIRLYALPLQLHPLYSPWHYAAPRHVVKQLWQLYGPFLTVGWPQDTIGLEDQCIDDQQFLDLCTSIFATREAILMNQIEHFSEGLLAIVFDSLDRIQHMFWRLRPDIIRDWYCKLDAMIGRVESRLAQTGNANTRIVIVSDHGFSDYNYKVHLNRWLIEQRYLWTMNGDGSGGLINVDWSETQAYALGLNGIYLNIHGREKHGSLRANEVESLVSEMRTKLLSWHGPDNQPVVQRVWAQNEAFEGPLSSYGPDLVVGFTPGYRASPQTGLGKWEGISIEPNRDHWHGDHCVNPEKVPGVIIKNDGLENFSNPSYKDIPGMTIGRIIDPGKPKPPPMGSDDQEIIEKRLKDLGYL